MHATVCRYILLMQFSNFVAASLVYFACCVIVYNLNIEHIPIVGVL